MRRGLLILGLVLAAVLVPVWMLGGEQALARWAAAGQREVQDAMAGALRRLRAGDPGALGALIAVAFGYGFFHAAGPGHGKLLIGGYGLGRRVGLWPLAGIALLSSLAQATVAVVLVHAGIGIFGWTRERVAGAAETVMAPLGYAAIALIGAWLALRGLRSLRRRAGAGQGHSGHTDSVQEHAHSHDAACGCGHRHAPGVEEVARLTGWRDTALLVGGIAIRPCTGALFLLVLTWQMQIPLVGVAGVYAMALGTGIVTVAVAGLAVWAREGTLATLPGAGLARAIPLLELGAGLALALVAGRLLLGSL